MAVNPFSYGKPITDPARFIGRESELSQILTRLRNAAFESSSVVGERRIGKSSLLNAVASRVKNDQLCVLSLDPQMLSSQATPRRFWDRVLRQLARDLPDGELKTAAEKLNQAESLDTFDLSDLFDELDDAGLSVLLLLDEFERVTGNPNFGPDFFYGLRSLAIHHRLALVTASYAELSSLSHSEDVRASPFFNIFATIHLGSLTLEEADHLFERYLAGSEVRFEESERALLSAIAGTQPYYLQIGGSFLFEAYQQGQSAEERLAYTRRRFTAEAEDTLAHSWRHSTDEEKITSLVLALLSTSGDIIPTAQVRVRTTDEEDTLQQRYRAVLRQLLSTYFDESELRTLCFDLNVKYDDLPGESRASKTINLIEYFERRRRLTDLVAMGTQLRPDVPWEELPSTTPAAPTADQRLPPESFIPAFDADRLTEYYGHAGPTLTRLTRRGLVVERESNYALFSTTLAEWIRNELQTMTPHPAYPQWLRDPINQRWLAQIRSDLAEEVKERLLPKLKDDYWELIVGWLSNPATVQAACGLVRRFVNP